jgi:glyoxylase-like metal-dependent hydrolase (beta-lactamase superfamily II)
MVYIKEAAKNIVLIDNNLYSIPRWGSVYLLNETRKALVDTGPARTLNAVLEGITQAGVKPEDIEYIIATHIHLDHTGGVGTLLKHMPKARVVVHHRGAKHLVNPERLVKSFAATMGEQLMAKTGEVLPVSEERILSVNDGDTLELGEGQVLTFIDAPGHAPHELCILESRNKGFFSGDAIGVSVADNRVLIPVTPPPGFDLETYLATLKKLASLDATSIYFAHFGKVDNAGEVLEMAGEKLRIWDKMISEAFAAGGAEAAARAMREQLYRELEPAKEFEPLYKYLADGIVAMNVAGYIKYYQDAHQSNQTGE